MLLRRSSVVTLTSQCARSRKAASRYYDTFSRCVYNKLLQFVAHVFNRLARPMRQIIRIPFNASSGMIQRHPAITYAWVCKTV